MERLTLLSASLNKSVQGLVLLIILSLHRVESKNKKKKRVFMF